MTARVAVDDRVWTAARTARRRHGSEWAIGLLLVPDGEPAPAARAVDDELEACRAAWDARGAGAAGSDPPSFGEWDAVRVAEGVRIQVVECDDFEWVLRGLADRLEQRGVGGRLGVWERPAPPVPPPFADVLICHLRPAGRRRRREAGWYAWIADGAAREAVAGAGVAWCRGLGDDAAHALQIGTIGPLGVETGEAVVPRVLAATASSRIATVSAVRGDAFRALVARPSGALVLAAGVTGDGGWRHELTSMLAVLRERTGVLDYAFVRRGWLVAQLLDTSLGDDWPVREDGVPRGAGTTSEAFEDVVAPDAFGVQLLGPAYADRGVDRTPWRSERLAADRTLLTHLDASAWFAAPFVRLGDVLPAAARPRPPVLVDARRTLAPLLYRPGALAAHGITDVA